MTRGIVWSAIERFSVQGIQFIVSIIIARLVMPSDYGLIAMMAIFLSIAQTFVDSGLGQALIHKEDCDNVDYSTAFFLNVIIAVTAYVVLFFTSPYIAAFYSQSKLEIILKLASLNIIINSFGLVQKAKLTRIVDFKTQAKASLCAVLISGSIGVFLAYKGFGVWALIFQSIASSTSNTITLWLLSKWRPLFVFSKTSFYQLYGFGGKILLTGLLSTAYNNIYSLVIGKFYNSAALGLYNRAYTLSVYPSSNLVNIISRVIYPIECTLQNDNIKLRQSFLKTIAITSYVIFPLMIGLAVLSKPFIMVILSPKWEEAATYLFITSLALMWNHIMFLNWQLLSVKGRTDLSLKSEIIKKIFSVLILVCSIPFGVTTMCWGQVFYSFLDMAIIILFLRPIIGIGYMDEIRVLFPSLAISLIMGILIYFIIQFISSYHLQLVVGIFTGVAIYILFSKLFKRWEYTFLTRKIKKAKNK